MIKSMTGFASISRESELATIGVTIRALNHRYLDLQLRLPPHLAALESRVRASVQRRVGRGRVEVTISVQPRQAGAVEVELNEPFADALDAALDRARERGLVSGPLTPGDLLRLPQALTIRDRSAERDSETAPYVTDLVEAAVEDALGALDAMRASEGEHLRVDLETHRAGIAALMERIAAAAEEGRGAVIVRLTARVEELTADLQIDRNAVAQEIVRTAARSDISEEVARFRGHLAHWDALASASEPCGRKLDFLLQEMNREVNTIASKADGMHVSEAIIEAKAVVERMREQVQNVE